MVGLLYGGSILLLLVGELALSRQVEAESFGAYQLIRQAVPFTVLAAVLGYDQALTRETAVRRVAASFDARQLRISFAALFAGTLVGALLHFEFAVPAAAAAALPIAAWGVSISSLISGVMRATASSSLAAFGQQGHRLLAGATLLVAFPFLSAIGAAFAFAFAAAAVAAFCLRWSQRQRQLWEIDRQQHRSMRLLGLGYCLSMLTMSFGDWADYALVAHLSGDLVEVGLFGQAKLLAVYPILSVGSILGFVALPFFSKRRETITREQVLRWSALGLTGALTVATVASPLTIITLRRVFDSPIPSTVVILLMCTGALRLFYVLPSALLGAMASARQLSAFGTFGVLGLLIQVGVTFSMADAGAATAAASGLLAGTIFRIVTATTMTVRLYRNKVERV